MGDIHLAKLPISTATINNDEPMPGLGVVDGFEVFHSKKSKTALMGIIKSMCVYSSLFRASEKVAINERHQMAIEKINSSAIVGCS